MKIPAKGFTHGGKFHADDVFSTALLQDRAPPISRSRAAFPCPMISRGIVYDIGGGHVRPPQRTARHPRPNGVPLCGVRPACGACSARALWANTRPACWMKTLSSRSTSTTTPASPTRWPRPSAASTRSGIPRTTPTPASGAPWRSRGRFWTMRSPRPTPSTVRRDRAARLPQRKGRHWSCCLPTCRGKTDCTGTDALFVVYPSQRGRLQRPVRDRLQDPPQQGAVPTRLGGQPEEVLRERSGLGLRAFATPAASLSRPMTNRPRSKPAAARCAPPESR